MSQRRPRRPLSTDQKRALFILAVMGILVVVIVVGIVSLAVSMGLPVWVAIIVAIVLCAVIGLFVLLNLA